MAKKNRWESARLNTLSYDLWYLRLKELAINMYEWHNLPDSCDERFLENTLFEKGFALFFKDEILDRFLALTATISGKWDVYNIPMERMAFANNDYHYHTNINDSVIIYNNYLHTPSKIYADMYALRIAAIERTMDVNINAQKTPTLISTSESQRLTLKNVYMQYEGNEPVIVADKTFDPNTVSVLNTQAPFVAPQLLQLKHWYFNEYLTFLGIENANEDKKERMVAGEVGANYGSIEAHRFIGLNARNQACDKINRMFGLNISVTYRSNLSTLVNQAFKTLQPYEGEVINE